MSVNPNMANREVADLVFKDYKTQKPYFNFDFANVTTTELTSDRVKATGGRGCPDRIGFDSKRTGTLTIETQITPMKLLAILAGQDISESAIIPKKEILTSTTDTDVVITLSETPVENSVYVYAIDDDCGTALETTVVDDVITLTSGETDTKYIVYYMVQKDTGVQSVLFDSKTFPKTFTIDGETLFKTEDDELLAMKLIFYKAQPQSSIKFNFSNSGDPTTMTITCDLYANDDNKIFEQILITD